MKATCTPDRAGLFTALLVGLLATLLAIPTMAQKPGLHDRTLESGGKEREYLLHIPRGYRKNQKKLLPLVLMLHGRSSSGRGASNRYYGWRPLADKENFIVVFPTALGSPTSWKSRGGRSTEDSQFLAELIDKMVGEHRIDRNRVYMTGHSSGGFMSFSFAMSHAEKVAAIGPVAGLQIGRTAPKVPVSVISFHGMEDAIVGYENGSRSAMNSAAFFAKHNKCAKPTRKDMAKGMVHVDRWTKGKNKTEVVLYSLKKGGHGWPQSGSRSVDATPLIWEFFKAHPRQSGRKQKSRQN